MTDNTQRIVMPVKTQENAIVIRQFKTGEHIGRGLEVSTHFCLDLRRPDQDRGREMAWWIAVPPPC